MIPVVVAVKLSGRSSRIALFRISEAEVLEGTASVDAGRGVCGGLVSPKLTQLDGPMGVHITWLRTGLGSGETVHM